MTLKKYLRPEEAAEYLHKKTGEKYTLQSIADLAFHGQIIAVIRFEGWEDTDFVYGKYGNFVSKRKLYIKGYFTTEYLFQFIEDSYVYDQAQHHLWKVWECLHSKRSTPPKHGDYANIRPEPFKTTRHKVEEGSLMYEIQCTPFGWNAIYIPRTELDALIAKHQADSTPSPAPVAVTEPAPQQTEAPPEALSAKASALPAELAAVLDPTHPDHAPDLADAIRLWLALYGGETTKHSHGTGYKHWMKAQGINQNFIDGTAGERIRDISSPHRVWDAQRKERHASRKKQD